MKIRQRSIALVSLLGIFCLPWTGSTATVSDQHTVSVSAVVEAPPPPEEPETRIRFEGLAYPNAEIVIQRNGSNWATTTADAAAVFSYESEIDPGTYTFSLIGTDSDGLSGPALSLSLSINEGVTVTASGIFLGPTISSSSNAIRLDETVTLSGFTVPGSAMTLYLSGPENDESVGLQAQADGRWSFTLRGGIELPSEGTYEVQVRAIAPDNSVSELSKTLTIAVSQTAPDPCDFANIADLNCDSFVNLVDFSILLFYWLDTSPNNPRADIDRSGRVDVVDFSIMMFHWTG